MELARNSEKFRNVKRCIVKNYTITLKREVKFKIDVASPKRLRTD